MIKLDYLTLGVAVSMVLMLSFLVIGIIWRINKYEKGLSMWVIASALGAVTEITIYFFPYLGSGTIFITNVGSLVGQLCLLEGILRFRKCDNQSLRMKIMLYAVIFIVVISFINKNNSTIRYLVHDFIASTILLLSTFFLMRNTSGNEKKIYSITAGSLVMMMLTFMYRWYLAFIGAFKSGEANSFMGLFYMIIVLWILGWTYGLVVAISYKDHQRILDVASHDDLTGVANRKNLHETLKRMMNESNSTNQKFLVFMLDLNGFKNINDTYGHIFGDRILIMMANAINEVIRDKGYVARLGGDEFVILVKSKADKENVNKIKSCIRNSVETIRFVDEKKVLLRISIGCAVYPDHGLVEEDIINYADSQMYEEKIYGRPVSVVVE